MEIHLQMTLLYYCQMLKIIKNSGNCLMNNSA